MANLWAMYYLRDVPILIYPYRGYAAQSHVVPLMDRSSQVPLSTIRYVLTDHQTIMPYKQTTLVWTGERYKLWHIETKNWAFIVDIKNPNGVESWNNRTGLWLGQEKTSLGVISSRRGNAVLSAEFSPGPSLPGSQERHLAIKTDKGYQTQQTIFGVGSHFIDIPLVAGRNQIDLISLDKPTLSVMPNGDPRRMLVGMRDPELMLKNDKMVARLNGIRNQNGLEQDSSGVPFFWLGNGETEIELFSRKSGIAHFAAEAYPGPSLPQSHTRRLNLSIDRQVQKLTIEGPQETFSFAVPVRAGKNVIRILSLDKPLVLTQPNGDTRPLLLMFKNLHIAMVTDK